MTEAQLPTRRPATNPKKVKAAVAIATVAVIGSGAAFLSAQNTGKAILDAATSTVVTSTTVPPHSVQYQVGEVGVVAVTDTGTTLSIANILPLSGWSVTAIEQTQAGITVKFKSGTNEVTFLATYENGTVSTSVSTTNLFVVPVTAKPVRPVVTPTTVKPKPKPTTTTQPASTTTVAETTTTQPPTTTTQPAPTTTQRRHNDD